MLSRQDSNSQLNAATNNATTMSAHFQELKAEMNSFTSVFSSWLTDKRRMVNEDKAAYNKTLSDEQGITYADESLV